jgi:sugar phosphate isomerase/epimerase
MDNLIVSPCSNPEMTLEQALATYSAIGFRKFEVFTVWAKSAFDINKDPADYLAIGRKYEMSFPSFHLPMIKDDFEAGLAVAIKAARFAAAVGARIVLFKADTRANLIRAAKPFLDGIAGLNLTPVMQNHMGTAISSLDDFREVLDGIHDPRMKTLLEVGHFHSAGVHWRDGYALLKDSIALVHIKDQIGRDPVPFGKGEIDLPGLFRHMRAVGYKGDYVIEMENKDKENTPRYLADARDYVRTRCMEN